MRSETRLDVAVVGEEPGTGALAHLSRTAVWSFLGGAACFLTLPTWGSAGTLVAGGVGFLISGVAVMAASGLMLRRWRRLNAIGRTVALVGVPFGASLLGASAGLVAWGGFLKPLPILGPALSLLLLLGVVLVVLIGVGAVRLLQDAPDPGAAEPRAMSDME